MRELFISLLFLVSTIGGSGAEEVKHGPIKTVDPEGIEYTSFFGVDGSSTVFTFAEVGTSQTMVYTRADNTLTCDDHECTIEEVKEVFRTWASE